MKGHFFIPNGRIDPDLCLRNKSLCFIVLVTMVPVHYYPLLSGNISAHNQEERPLSTAR